MVNASTSGAMQQGVMNLVPMQATVPVLDMPVKLLHHSLAVSFIVSPALTQNQPVSGIRPIHCGTAKAATMVAGAATPVVHRGSGRHCLQRRRPILKFAGVIHITT